MTRPEHTDLARFGELLLGLVVGGGLFIAIAMWIFGIMGG